MPRFAYTVIDASGKERTGTEDAPDGKFLAGQLRARGLAPISLNLAESRSAHEARPGGTGWGREIRRPGRRGGGRKELTVFTRQLATLLRAGMPLLRGLEVLARQERRTVWRRMIEALMKEIQSGGTLSAALERFPEIFDRLYINMVKAGEAGGALAVVLDRLALFLQKSRQLRSKLTAAMLYPVLVLLVAAGILTGLLVFVVPKFEQIFADLLKGAPLPPLTRWVLAASTLVKDQAVPVILVVSFALILLNLWRKTAAGSRWLAAGGLKMPVLGELLCKGVVARLARTFGTLLASGVPLLPALLITRDACGNARIAQAMTGIHARVKEGAAMAAAFNEAGVFPPMVPGLLEVGEHTGELPAMLVRIADIYDDEVDHAVAGLSSLIEPLLILFLALVVGTIVIALFLPIVRIVQLLA